MVTGKRPTDKMFMEGMSIVNFVQKHFPDQIMQTLDVSLQEDDDDALYKATEITSEGSMHQCVLMTLEMGLVCTGQSPKERPGMQEVARKLYTTRVAYPYLEDGSY